MCAANNILSVSDGIWQMKPTTPEQVYCVEKSLTVALVSYAAEVVMCVCICFLVRVWISYSFNCMQARPLGKDDFFVS